MAYRSGSPRPTFWYWVILLGLLAVAVRSGYLRTIDALVEHWFIAMRTPMRDDLSWMLTFFVGVEWVLGVMLVMSVWLLWRQRATLVVFWSAWLVGFTVQILLRYWVGQWRPDTASLPAAMSFAAHYDLAGFTSGHAFRAAFLYGWWCEILWRRRTWWAKLGAAVCVALVIMVGITRIYLNRHWFTDVLGAWFLAAGVLFAASLWRTRWIARKVEILSS